MSNLSIWKANRQVGHYLFEVGDINFQDNLVKFFSLYHKLNMVYSFLSHESLNILQNLFSTQFVFAGPLNLFLHLANPDNAWEIDHCIQNCFLSNSWGSNWYKNGWLIERNKGCSTKSFISRCEQFECELYTYRLTFLNH